IKIMFSQPKMIDRATGASPPWSNTKEMASSPIHLDPTIEITMSNDHYDDDLASIDRIKQSVEKIMAMNEYVSSHGLFPEIMKLERNFSVQFFLNLD
ncbi:unnamed protein product, partial [Rotaria magnacalcarata]